MDAGGRVASFKRLRESTLRAANEILLLPFNPETRRIIGEIGENRNERPARIHELKTFVQLGIEMRNEGNDHIGIGFAPAIREHVYAPTVIRSDRELQNAQQLGAA